MARRLHRGDDRGVRRGRRRRGWRARYADVVPRGLQGGLLRGAPARSTSAGSRRSASAGTDLSLFSPLDAARGEARLKVFRRGRADLAVARCCPLLSSMGVEVVDERPYQLDARRPPVVHLRVRAALRAAACPTSVREPFQDAIRAVWDGYNEIDGFNALVLARRADLAAGHRAARLRQVHAAGQQPRSPVDYIEEALRGNTDITRLLVQLFEARFDPGRNGLAADAEARTARVEEIDDADRARARRRRQPRPRPDPALLPDPHPRDAAHQLLPDRRRRRGRTPTCRSSSTRRRSPTCPRRGRAFEIFVYSPRVEGVHLRFGAVARGGLRWSDRRDDFRTEVLGLVKAQMVKNTVIVPVGAKGGFFCKQLPDPADRDAWLAEGIACYKTFICGLLDITDNLVDGADRAAARRRAPRRRRLLPRRRRRQGHRDVLRHRQRRRARTTASGSATRSPPAARSATTTRRWASPRAAPGSRCSGTSASCGVDCQTEDFTCVGIGDMSGDVFGNGMLCSEHTRLVAAFDHRDIFLDPDPDAGRVVRRAASGCSSCRARAGPTTTRR